jgi:hypothetical protein
MIGISQRDMTFYDFLKGLQDELEQKIVDFYKDKIQGRFPDPDCKFWCSRVMDLRPRVTITLHSTNQTVVL